MRIRYTPQLLDEAVSRELLRREEAGDASWVRDWHAVTDRFYELPESPRRAAFAEASAVMFRRLGLARPFETVAAELGEALSGAPEMVVDRTASAIEEEADLMVGEGSSVRLRLRTARFDDLAALEGFARHEVRHVADMLSPAFGYRPEPRYARRPAEENLVRARLRLIWNVAIAGAIARDGRRGAAARDVWEKALRRQYPSFPDADQAQIFETLWTARDLSWPRLLDLARDPAALAAAAGVSPASLAAPGALCPLCGFPTFAWADLDAASPALLAAIASDFAAWTPGKGACRHCVDSYDLRSRWSSRSAETNRV